MKTTNELKDIKISDKLVITEYTTTIELSPEDIQTMIDYVRSEENDKLLLQYKNLSNEELAAVVVEEYKRELYSTLEKLCRE